MVAFPMHSCPFETSLDDILVGTLYHTGTNRPTIVSELRVLHQHLAFAQVVQVLVNPFSLCKMALQTISHAQQGMGISMLEDMQTAIKHVRRAMHVRLLQGFEQFGDMFCRMGKIQNPYCVRPMLVGKNLQPVCPIHDSTHLLSLGHLASLHLHF
ncbi:hypothetical protein ccbrp13_63840 [Ktedonobacteria bacterium brp13]|nr:hypothetical protein ccbrp13_63840 [Ktedonobacteria bacterium brp13]